MTLRVWVLAAWDLACFYVRCFGLFHRTVRQEFGWPYRDAERMVCLRCGYTRDRLDDE